VRSPGQCWQPADGTLSFLRGSWRADRVLTDFLSGRSGSFRGVAEFAAGSADGRPEVVFYRERGELLFGGHHGPASRSLLYLPAPDGTAEVQFSDGRPFYRLDLRSGSCQAEHPCGRDRYLLVARVLGPDCFTERWRARGPGKDYEMTTTFARIGA
jgi:hypothetical protein